MTLSFKSKVARIRPTVFAIYRKVYGAQADETLSLANLEDGFEQLVELTEAAFELADNWTGDGTAVNGTLQAFIEQVAKSWDGKFIDDSWTNEFSVGPLLHAVQQQNWPLAVTLVETGAALDEQDHRGWTALHSAAAKNQRALARALLNAGANVELESTKAYSERGDGVVPKGTAPWAIRGTCLDLLNPVGVVRRDTRGNTLLHLAAAEKSVSVDMALVDKCVRQLKIDVNAVNNFGWTALHYACSAIANCELIVQLVAFNAKPGSRTTKRHKGIAAGTDALGQLAQGGYDGKGTYYWSESRPNSGLDVVKPWRNYSLIYFTATAAALLSPMRHQEFSTSQHPVDLRR